MAYILAAQNGNWSETSTWQGGVVPGPGDVAVANGKTVTIDVNATCDEVTTAAVGGGVAGGGFTLASGRTLTATVRAGSSTCVTFSTAGGQAWIVGNVFGGQATGAHGVNNTSTGTITITGNVTGGSGSDAYGVNNTSTGTITITGNVTGGSAGSAYGVNNASTGTITITGNVTGGSAGSAYGVYNASSGTVTINGDVVPTASQNATAVWNHWTGQITINGNVYSGRNAPSVYANGGWIRINGDLLMDLVNGNAPAVGSSLNGLVRINGNIRHHYGTTGLYGLTLATGRVLFINGSQRYTQYAEDNGQGVPTGNPVVHAGYDAVDAGYPAERDVRYSVAYGAAGERTGTCHVPPPESVLYGVPVDDTVGIAAVTPEAIASAVWNALRADYNSPGTFGAVSEWSGGGGGGSDWTEDEKKQIRHRLGIDGVATAPTNEAPSLLTVLGYTQARASKLDYLDAPISSRSSHSPADVWQYANRTLTAFGFTVTVDQNNDKTGYSLTEDYDRAKTALAHNEYTPPPSAQSIAAAVWDANRSEHTTTGTFGAVHEWAASAQQVSQQVLASPIDGQLSLKQSIAIIGAAVAGKLSGAHTNTITIAAMGGDAARIVATVDAVGNRISVNLNPPA